MLLLIKQRRKNNKKGKLQKGYLHCDQGGKYHDQARQGTGSGSSTSWNTASLGIADPAIAGPGIVGGRSRGYHSSSHCQGWK